MEFISTTATLADKLKRLAKTRRKTTGTSLAVALDVVSQEHGYAHWKHVTVCVEQTTHLRQRKSLPPSLKSILDEVRVSHPASHEAQQAFARGLVFAMDVKDAEQLSLTTGYVECEDGWHLAAEDLWQALLRDRGDVTGTTPMEAESSEDLTMTAMDDLQNYRFFRRLGNHVPRSLEEAYEQIHQISFFPPSHIWLRGRFIDLAEVPEIRIDGRVVLSTTAEPAVALSDSELDRSEQLTQLLTLEEQAIFSKMTVQEQDFWLRQLEKAPHTGKARYVPAWSSLDVSWQNAKKPKPE